MTETQYSGAYLAGPMTGIEDYNYPAFHTAAAQLRRRGWLVINPAENFGGNQGLPYEAYLAESLAQVHGASALVLLPGWENSKGTERELAQAWTDRIPVIFLEEALVMPVPPYHCSAELVEYDLAHAVDITRYIKSAKLESVSLVTEPIHPDWKVLSVTDETILQEAQRLVHGDRGADYGTPLDNFETTARFWEPVLGIKVTAEQVALCMVGLKLAREVHKPKRDNVVDAAGYLETYAMVLQEREEIAHPPQVVKLGEPRFYFNKLWDDTEDHDDVPA